MPPRPVPIWVRPETTARYLLLPLVSCGFASAFPNCTGTYSGPRQRSLLERRLGLGDRPQVRTRGYLFAFASLSPDTGGSQGLRNCEPPPNGNGRARR